MNTEIPDRNDKKAFALHISAVTAAFAEGKPIQFKRRMDPDWTYPPLQITDCPDWDWLNRDYRIAPAPQPTHEAWTFETGPEVVKVRRKEGKQVYVAQLYVVGYLLRTSRAGWEDVTFEQLIRDFEQLDGSACGVKREEVEPEWPKWFRDIYLWRMDSEEDGVCWMDLTKEPVQSACNVATLIRSNTPRIPAHEARALIAKGGAR